MSIVVCPGLTFRTILAWLGLAWLGWRSFVCERLDLLV